MRVTTLALATTMLVGACADGPDAASPPAARPAAQPAAQMAQALAGTPKARLLACAGQPSRQAVVEGVEYLTYSRRPVGFNITPGQRQDAGVGIYERDAPIQDIGVPNFATNADQGCDVTVIVRKGAVADVSYPFGANLEACGEILAACRAAAK